MSFDYHHRSHSRHTRPAGMFLKGEADLWHEAASSRTRHSRRFDKRFHNKKSRYYFRDEMRKQINGEEFKV